MNKRADGGISKQLMSLILVLLVVIIGIGALIKFGGTEIINNIFPSFGENHTVDGNVQISKDWNTILKDYEKVKCQFKSNILSCEAINVPCGCFSQEQYDSKKMYDICDASKPYCYEFIGGCSSIPTTYSSEDCRTVLSKRNGVSDTTLT